MRVSFIFDKPFRRFLASTHYTHYNPWFFAINLSALIFVLIPKLPMVIILHYNIQQYSSLACASSSIVIVFAFCLSTLLLQASQLPSLLNFRAQAAKRPRFVRAIHLSDRRGAVISKPLFPFHFILTWILPDPHLHLTQPRTYCIVY